MNFYKTLNPRRHAALLLLLAISLSSCRFGNHADPYKPLQPGEIFKSVDLYFTQATQLSTTVYTVDTNINDPNAVISAKTNANTPLVAIPGSILNTMTNPVYFAVPQDTVNYKPMFVDLSQSTYIYTGLDKDKNINYQYATATDYLWSSPDCLTQVVKNHSGVFNNSHPGTYVDANNSSHDVKGHVQISIRYRRLFGGNCSSDLTQLGTCYLNGAGCSSDQLSAASALFDLHVRQAGLINLATDDLSKIIALEYTVKYE